MVIIREVNSFIDLVVKATTFANQLQDNWYQGSAEVHSFKHQVWILRQKHDQWSAQLRRHGVSEDEILLRAVQAAVQVLQDQEQYLRRLQKNPLLRLRRKAFPSLLTYSLKNVSDIVDAGPQLLAARVATFDLLERVGAQTPAQLPFIPDPSYVPISQTILEIRKALEDNEGPRVVSVFGGPGLGKTSVVKYLALQYQEERQQGLRQTQRKPLSFPDGVYYLFCGKDDKDAQDRVKQLQLDLLDCLGFGPGSSAPRNVEWTGNGMQEGAYLDLTSPQLKLQSRLAEQMLLIVLDDIWEREVLQQLLVPVKGVKYLITSQMKEIWSPAAKIQMRYPTFGEARQIMSNYTNGLPMKGKFPHNIQSVTDAIIQNVGSHPLCLANVGISINSSRATDGSRWKAINDDIHALLHEVDEVQGSPAIVYEQSYHSKIGASMMLMVECLHPNARGLLFLIALLGGEHLPETLVRYFYKWMHPAEPSTDVHLKYENQEKYLADRSLVDMHVQGNESTLEKRTLTGHGLRMRYIREKNAPDVQSIAAQIVQSGNQGGTELSIQKGDAEATLVTILSAMYFPKPLTVVVANTLEKHLRILADGTIPRNLSRGIDPHKLLSFARSKMNDLVWLINVDHRDPDWKHQAHGYAKKIIIKLACQGTLDDYSMAGLLQLPQTTTVACAVLDGYFGPYGSHDSDRTVSSTNGETMNTLLALLHDDGVSTTRRVAVIRALGVILDYESKDTILSVAAKYMEVLAIDFSDSVLQIAVAQYWCRYYFCARRGAILMGEFTRILDCLMGLLVSGKAYKVRLSAAKALLWFCQWKCTSLKVAAIPHALEILFNLFLSIKTLGNLPFTWGFRTEDPPYLAGYMLGYLTSVEENRNEFCAVKSGLDGLGNILARLKGTWQATDNERHRRELEEQASIAAGILDHLALDKDLRDSIASLPGLEEGLLFLQLIEIRRIPDRVSNQSTYLVPFNSTRALTKLCFTSTSPRFREVPPLKQVQGVSSCDKFSPEMELTAYCNMYWTRALTHTEMGAYTEALENLNLAQHHFDQIPTPEDGRLLIYMTTSMRCGGLAATILSFTRRFLQAMSGDHAGTLSGSNRVESTFRQRWKRAYRVGFALTEKGILKRVCEDLKGANDDLNGACQVSQESGACSELRLFNILKQRGYVKYLMKDKVGGKADAESSPQLQLKHTFPDVEATEDCKLFWDPRNLPINYLGYFS